MELICSIGPSVNNIEDIKLFVEAGMTMPRFNFSHIDYVKFETLIKEIHITFPNMNSIQDLQGNKLRVSKLFSGEYKVNINDYVIFCIEKDYNYLYEKYKYKNIKLIPIMYNGSLDDFKNVKELFMKDATMKFKVVDKQLLYIKAITIKGGILRAEKGINAPKLIRDNLLLTDKDKKDIEIGIKNNIDIICLSYVTKANDIIEIKAYIKDLVKIYKCKTPRIWAKIECKEALNNFEEILKVSDGIMLGRGDLKAEIPIQDIPYEEEKIICRMKKSRKMLIVATYILESMRRQDCPSISEVNDIYKFIKNNVDGLMLSTEVAVTRDPVKVISCLKNIYNRYCN